MAEQVQSNASIITAERNRIFSLPLKYGGKAGEEIIDIVSDYAWIADASVGNQDIEFTEEIATTDSKGQTSSLGGSFSKKNNLPFCYVIERVSAVNAGIANMLNILSKYNDISTSALGGMSKVEELFTKGSGENKESKPANAPNSEAKPAENTPAAQNANNTNNSNNANNSQQNAPATNDGKANEQPNTASNKNTAEAEGSAGNEGESSSKEGGAFSSAMRSSLQTIQDTLNKLIKGTNFDELIKGNNLNCEIFSPYRFLYITKDSTKKRYVFPLLNGDSSFGTVKNTWGKAQALPGFLQTGLDWLNEASLYVSGGINFLSNLTGFISGKDSEDIGNVNETAKTFTYPTNGDTLTVNFTLYNTTKINAWKDNYQFLYLFTLRNLPFRIDSASFLPPLLYDIIVPGVKRLPICSVDNIKIAPKGMTRTLSCNNFIKGSGTIHVNVPEAWEVSITFTSLIATSANMMLAEMIGGLGITAALSETAEMPETPNPEVEPKEQTENKDNS